MARFGIVKDSLVINIAEAESGNKEILELLIPDCDFVILETEETGFAFIGEAFIDGKFMPPKPYSSWIFNNELWKYEAPIAYPDISKPYSWNEETQSWEEIVLD